jgi:hypothetical protein
MVGVNFLCMRKYTYILTYLRSWALLEEPLIVQPLKNFPAFYETRRFNTVFTRALHWFLSWAIWIQSTPSHPVISGFLCLVTLLMTLSRGCSVTVTLSWLFPLNCLFWTVPNVSQPSP